MTFLRKYGALLFLIVISACVHAVARAQASTGEVSGHITCDDGNFPARGAVVELLPLDQLLPGAPTPKSEVKHIVTGSTDFVGLYELPAVEAGTSLVHATMEGYSDDLKLVRTVLDQYTPDQQQKLLATFPQVTVKAGATLRQDIVLQRAAAISGHVSVDTGGTLGKVRVNATLVSGRLIGDAGSGAEKGKSVSFSQASFTDDRGIYRIAGLPPGSYRLSARYAENFLGVKILDASSAKVLITPQRSGLADLTVFAPESLEETGGRLVKVDNGDDIADADITIPSRLLHSIAGTITQAGAPIGGVSITLKRHGQRVGPSDALSMPDGSYQFDLLPPGDYMVSAQTYDGEPRGKPGPAGGITVQLSTTDALNTDIDLHAPAAKSQ